MAENDEERSRRRFLGWFGGVGARYVVVAWIHRGSVHPSRCYRNWLTDLSAHLYQHFLISIYHVSKLSIFILRKGLKATSEWQSVEQLDAHTTLYETQVLYSTLHKCGPDTSSPLWDPCQCRLCLWKQEGLRQQSQISHPLLTGVRFGFKECIDNGDV